MAGFRSLSRVSRWSRLLIVFGISLVLAAVGLGHGAMVHGAVVHGAEDPGVITPITWQQTAQSYRGSQGDRVFYCPAQGQLYPLWGSDMYAEDSSICSAAVHAGLITVVDGGAIAIRPQPGQLTYPTTTQNEVTSSRRGGRLGSFTFTSLHDPIAGVVEVRGDRVPVLVGDWETTAESYDQREGDAMALYCPPNGTRQPIWGSKTYRTASSVCTAAVHDDEIDPTAGGIVAIQIRSPRDNYRSTRRHGVESLAFDVSSPGFRFVSYRPAS